MSSRYPSWTSEILLEVLSNLNYTIEDIDDFKTKGVCKTVTKRMCHEKYSIKHQRELQKIWHSTDLKDKLRSKLSSNDTENDNINQANKHIIFQETVENSLHNIDYIFSGSNEL